MKLVRFYSEGELSSISVSNEEETVSEVLNLFFDEQLDEEQIMLEIYSQNHGVISNVDELRLDFDRLFSKRQLKKKGWMTGTKLVDSSHYNKDFSIQTIIGIKNEQKYVNANFKSYVILLPRTSLFSSDKEPMLFATLKNNNYYWLNPEQSVSKDKGFKKFKNWIKRKTSSKTFSK